MTVILSKIEEQSRENAEQREKINSLISICNDQSQSINQLTKLCTDLKKQSEKDKIEMKHSIKELRNDFGIQSQAIKALDDKVSAIREEMNSKLDRVVQYIDDQDAY